MRKRHIIAVLHISKPWKWKKKWKKGGMLPPTKVMNWKILKKGGPQIGHLWWGPVLMVEEAGVECTLFVIYKAGREHTPYWWWVVVLPNNWYKPKALSHPGLEWLCVFIMDLNLILVYESGADPGRAHPTCAPPPPPPPPSPHLKLQKMWFFGVNLWLFTRNTPNIFAPPSARRNFFMCTPLTWNPGSAPVNVWF
jgi:hypothetical protein